MKTAMSSPAKIVLFLVAAVGAANATWAQDPFRLYKDYDRYRYLPRLPQGNENPAPLPNEEKPVEGDSKVLLDNLKGVVFVDSADKVQKNPGVTGVQVNGDLELLNCPEFGGVVQPYLGGQVSVFRLNELVRDVIRFYRENDQPVVDISIPEQDITTGVVQIVVTEGRLGRVHVKDACYFDPCVLLDQVCMNSGDPIYESDLMEELRWLYRNPFRTVDLELTPGENKGETDVVFHVKDKWPWRFYTGYEDTGTRSTGLDRLFVGANWFNAFDQDDYLGYQYTFHPNTSKFQSHSAFYTRHLCNRDILSIYAAAADYTATVPNFGNSPGESWQVLVRWYRELCACGCYEHAITAGFDFKQTNSSLFFGPVPVFAGTFDVVQFMAGYVGKEQLDCGSYSIGADFYFSPGGLSNHNNNAAFQLVRANALANYFYARGFFDRHWNLCDTGAEFVIRGTGQVADGNLVAPEQLFFGGYNSVRGYDDYATLGDSGFFLNFELWSDPICGLLCCDDQLRGLAFYDWGVAYNHRLLPGEDGAVDHHSVGVGLRYDMKPNVQARFDYAWQLEDVPPLGDFNSRGHIGVVFSH